MPCMLHKQSGENSINSQKVWFQCRKSWIYAKRTWNFVLNLGDFIKSKKLNEFRPNLFCFNCLIHVYLNCIDQCQLRDQLPVKEKPSRVAEFQFYPICAFEVLIIIKDEHIIKDSNPQQVHLRLESSADKSAKPQVHCFTKGFRFIQCSRNRSSHRFDFSSKNYSSSC